MRHDTAHLIGSGGMGEVYRAWDPTLERHVALKYLRHADGEMVERLLREARAQARIDHPGICKVYEVGEDDGLPYIAMQYVDGKLLDEASETMTLERKVLVVKQVAEAVQAAHAEGLIHRDLKPGNIMVTETESGELRPYVLDFGIAREQTVPGLTATGQVLGTPGYLSPEQARGEGVTMDRRTDIFSLGAVLYELCSGSRPFKGDSNVEILVSLLEDEPVPLRTKAPALPHDLETVVMRCLEKEPERRYPSARALSEDLGRFLDGEPVEARPVGRVERLVRRARKHRAFTAVVIVASVIVVGLLGTLIGGWAKYTADLKRERDVARAKEQEATEIADFLVGVFEVSDPGVSLGETVTARELLHRGADRIGAGFEHQPLVRARLLLTIGTIYMKLGLLAESEPLVEEALQIRETHHPADDPAVATGLDQLGVLRTEQGRYDEADAALARALEIRTAAPRSDRLDVAATLCNLSTLRTIQGRLEEASTLLAEAISIREGALGPDHAEVAEALGDQGIVLSRLGRLDEAESAYTRSLHILEGAVGEEHPEVSACLLNLGILATDQGRYDQAGTYFERALAIQEKVLGPEHPTVAKTLVSMSINFRRQSLFEEAEPPLRRALAIREKVLGPDHAQIGGGLNSLGNIYDGQGRLAQAEECYLRAVAIFEKALGPDHAWVAIPLNNAGNLYLRQELYGRAEPVVRRSLEIRERALGEDHPEVALSLESLAAICTKQGRLEEAESLFRRTLDIRERTLPDDHPYIDDTRRELAGVLRSLGREAEAAEVEAAVAPESGG